MKWTWLTVGRRSMVAVSVPREEHGVAPRHLPEDQRHARQRDDVARV